MKKLLSLNKFFFSILFFLLTVTVQQIILTQQTFASGHLVWHPAGVNTNWSNANNWRITTFGGSISSNAPLTADTAEIGPNNNNFTVILDVDSAVAVLIVSGTGQIFINGSTKTLRVTGNIFFTNTNSTGGGSCTIKLNGASQTLSGNTTSTGLGKMPNITFNSTATITLSNYLTMGGSTKLKYIQGTITGTSTFAFYNANTIEGNFTLYNAEFMGTSSTVTITDTLTLNGDLSLTGSSYALLNNNTIKVKGNINISGTSTGNNGGTGTIKIIGTANQSITSTTDLGKCWLPNITIMKTSGTLTLSGNISMYGNWINNYSRDDIDPGTSELFFWKNNQTQTIGGNFSTILYKASFGSSSNCTYSFGKDSALIIKNKLTTKGAATAAFNNYSITIEGDLQIDNTGNNSGSTNLIFRGANKQTIASSVAITQGALPSIVIAKSADTLVLSGVVTVYGNWTNNYGGPINAGTSKVSFKQGNGTINIGGTYPTRLYGVVFGGNQNCTYSIDSDSALIITDTVFFSGNGWLRLNNHCINIEGVLKNTNSYPNNSGTTIMNFTGTKNQSIISTTAPGEGFLSNVKLIKTAGTVNLYGNISVSNSWTNNYSTANVICGTSIFYFYTGNLTTTIGGTYPTKLNEVIFGGSSNCTIALTIDSALIITDTLKLQSTGSITLNNYSLVAKGNVVNSNSHASTMLNSTLYLKGSNNQYLKGTYDLKCYKIVMNKTSNSLTLNKNLTITNNLTFTTRNIISSSGSILTFNDNATATGASNNSFVDGVVKKVGNEGFKFPIGKGTTYKPDSISAPSTTSDAFVSEYFDSTNANTMLDGVLTYRNNCEFWNLNHTAGSATVNVKLYWDNPCFHIASLSYFKVGYVSSGTWTSAGTCTTSGNTTTGTIASSTARSTWGDITLAKTNPLLYAHTGSDAAICNGSSASTGSTATGGASPFSYAWSPTTGLSSSTINNPTASPTVTTFYVVTATDNNNEIAKDTITITVNAKPVAHAGSDVALCNGSSTSTGSTATSGTSPYTYSWSPSTGLSSVTVASPTANPTATTSYTVTVTDVNGCTGNDEVTVTINSIPSAHAGADAGLCLGASVTVGASPAATGGTSPYSYAWSPSTALSTSTIAQPSANPNTTTTYTLTVTDVNGCTGNDEVIITIHFLPTAHAGNDTTIMRGITLHIGGTLSATGGTSPYTYAWLPVLGVEDSTISPVDVKPFDTIIYHLTVTDVNSCTATDSVIVNIISFPDLGLTGTYSILSGGTINSSGTIYSNGKIGASGSINATIVTNDSIIENGEGSVNKALIDLNSAIDYIDNLSADTINGNLSGLELTEGIYRIEGNAELNDSLILSGDSLATFIFDIDSSFILSANSSIKLNNVNYRNVIFNINKNLEFYDTVNLTGIFFIKNNISGGSIEGDQKSILAGNSIIIENGRNFSASSSTGLSNRITITGCGIKYKIGSASINKRGNFSQEIGQNQPALINIPGVPTGSTIIAMYVYLSCVSQVAITSQNFILTDVNSSTTGTYTANQIGTFYNTGNQAGTCWNGDWYGSIANGDYMHFLNETSFRGILPQTFYNSLIPNGGGTYQINVSGLPTINQTISGDDIDFNGISIIVVYSDCSSNIRGTLIWDDGLISSGGLQGQSLNFSMGNLNIPSTYIASSGSSFAMLSDIESGTTTPNPGLDKIYINSWPQPWLFSVSGLWNCTIYPFGIDLYSGQNNIPFFISTTTDCFDIIASGIYYQSTSLTCPDYLSFSISNYTICNGGSVQISPSIIGEDIPDISAYSWSPSIGLSNLSIKNPIASPTITTTYTLTITFSNGCTQSSTSVVNVDPQANFNISPSGPILFCNDLNSITLTATGTNVAIYLWTPSIGLNTSTGSIVVATPSVTTTYTLYGFATDFTGCFQSKTVIVKIQDCCEGFDPSNQNGVLYVETTISKLSEFINTYDGTVFDAYPSDPHKFKLYSYAAMIFNNNLEIDESYEFAETDMEFGANVNWYIPLTASDVVLTLTDDYLHAGCDDMWTGITNYNTDCSIFATNSVFEDAVEAIAITQGGNCYLDKCTFNKNYIGVFAYYLNHLNYSKILKCTFKCDGNLINPIFGQKSLCGIYLYINGTYNLNIDGNSTSNPPNNWNLFTTGLKRGILIKKSKTLISKYNHFEDIHDIVGTIDNGAGIEISSGISYVTVHGSLPDQLINFSNCPTGIYLNSSSGGFYLDNNNMDNVGCGLKAINNISSTLRFRYNKITNCVYGVSLSANIGSDMEVGYNEIHLKDLNGIIPTSNYYKAIAAQSLSMTQSGITIICNSIYTNHLGRGIYLYGMHSSVLPYENYNYGNSVIHNYIYLNADGTSGSQPYTIGIESFFCRATAFFHNEISGDAPNTNAIYFKRYGINSTSNNSCLFKCNNLDKTNFGFQFLGSNPSLMIDRNILGDHYDGMLFTNCSSDYLIGNLNDASNNDFNSGSFLDYGAKRTGSSTFLVRFTANSTYLGFSHPSNIIEVLTNTTTHAFCPSDPSAYWCPEGAPRGAESILFRSNPDEFDYGIALDTISWDYAATKREMNRYLFEKIETTPDSFLIIDLFKNYYDSLKRTELGEFMQVYDTLEALNDSGIFHADSSYNFKSFDDSIYVQKILTLKDILSAINPELQTAIDEKEVYEIYLGTLALGIDTFTQSQRDILWRIANQCLLNSGRATYDARLMVNFFYPDTFYNDSLLCDTVSFRKENSGISNENKFYVSVYPNPANDEILLKYDLGNNESGEFQISDAFGRIVLKIKLDKKDKVRKINASTLPDGFYHYSLYVRNESQANGKVVILH